MHPTQSAQVGLANFSGNAVAGSWRRGRSAAGPGLTCWFGVEPPAGIEPATPSLPSMRGSFTTPCSTSRGHTTVQVGGAANGGVVGRGEVTCSAVSLSGRGVLRRPRHHHPAGADRQCLRLPPQRPSPGCGRRARRGAAVHPSLSAPNQRQGGTVQPHLAGRVGLPTPLRQQSGTHRCLPWTAGCTCTTITGLTPHWAATHPSAVSTTPPTLTASRRWVTVDNRCAGDGYSPWIQDTADGSV